MVEVPSAVMMLDKLLKEVDFISIGTNDLIQYCLAVDRSNKDVANLYRASDPAVLRLINTTLRAARDADVPVNVCGEMSATPKYIPLLLGMPVFLCLDNLRMRRNGIGVSMGFLSIARLLIGSKRSAEN